MISHTEHDFLLETLDLAGKELIKRFGDRQLAVREKSDTSLVTDADLASERVILAQISKYFPDDLIFSEEAGKSSKDRPTGRHVWIIDPLDGTTNFANGYPFFVFLLAVPFLMRKEVQSLY